MGGLPSRSGENLASEDGTSGFFGTQRLLLGYFNRDPLRGKGLCLQRPSGRAEDCGVGGMEETPRRCRGRWRPFPCLRGGLASPPSSLGGCFGLCPCWEGALLKAIWVINRCKAAFPVLGWKCRGWRVPPVPPLGPSERRALGSESQSLYLGAAFRAGCSSSHPRGPYQPRAGGFPALISSNSGRAVGAAVRASRIAPRPLRPPPAPSPQVSDPKGQGKGLGGGFGAAGGHLGSCFGLFSSWGGSVTSCALQPPPRARGWWHEVPNTGTSPSGGCVVGMKFPQFKSFAEGSGGTKPSGRGFSGEMRGRRCFFHSEERSRR